MGWGGVAQAEGTRSQGAEVRTLWVPCSDEPGFLSWSTALSGWDYALLWGWCGMASSHQMAVAPPKLCRLKLSRRLPETPWGQSHPQ